MRKQATKLLLLLFACLLVMACAGPGLKVWHTDVEYDRALQGARRALIEIGMSVTAIDFENGFITAESRFVKGLLFKSHYVDQMSVYIMRTDKGISIEVGVVAGKKDVAGLATERHLMKKFAKNLKKYIPDAKVSSAY